MFDILKENKNNKFYAIKENLIFKAELDMGVIIPHDLKQLYAIIGYGFLETKCRNINRIMSPNSIREFYLAEGQFENSEEAEFYVGYTRDKIAFFEVNESLYLLIGTAKNNMGKVFYYEEIVANNLEEFFDKYSENERFYLNE